MAMLQAMLFPPLSILLYSIPLLLLQLHVSSCLPPVCQPFNGTAFGPALPTLSDRFIATMELTQSTDNMTMLLKEYYDYQRNMNAITTTALGLTSTTIFDYSAKRSIQIQGMNTRTPTCSVDTITRDKTALLQPTDASGHLRHTADLYIFNTSHPIEYRGVAYIREIRCNYWTICLNTANSSHLLHFYFAVDPWLLPLADQHSNPVLYRIEGVVSMRATPGDEIVRKEAVSIHYFSFKSEAPPSSSYQIPHGVVCPQLNGNLSSLPVIPDNFFSGIEYYSRITKKYQSKRIYHDFRHGLFRTEQGAGEKGWSYTIEDYNTDVMYTIQHTKSNSKRMNICTIKRLPPLSGGVNGTESRSRMQSAMQRYSLVEGDYTYQGPGTVRGRPVVVWSTRENNSLTGGKMSIVEWSFENETRMPLQYVTYAEQDTSNRYIVSFFDFEKLDTAPYSLRPLKYCYQDNSQIVQFRLKNTISKGVSVITRDQAIQDALAQFANVTLVRVSSRQVIDEGATLFIVTNLFGALSISDPIPGQSTPTPLPLQNAVSKLRSSVEQGLFTVTVTSNGMTYTSTAFPDSFSEESQPEISQPSQAPSKAGMSGATIALIVIASVLILIAMVIGVFFLLRRRGINVLAAYSRHT